MSLQEIQGVVNELAVSWSEFKGRNEDRLDGFERRLNKYECGVLAGGGKPTDDTALPASYRAVFNSAWAQKLSQHDYGSAFSSYARLGPNSLAPHIQGSLSVGSDREGGYLVPAEMQKGILSRIFEISPMRQICGIQPITSDALEGIFDASEVENGGWVAEQGERDETDPGEFGKYRIDAHEQYAQPSVTQKLLDDASIDIAGHLEGKISKKFAKDENAAFINGNGVGKPRGILDYGATAVTTDDDARDWGQLQYVATGVSGAFPTMSGLVADNPDPLHDVVSKLKPAYRSGAKWLMNRATAAVIRKMKDGNGRNLWVDGLQAGEPDRLLGYPTVMAEDMPDLASNSLSIAFGNFQEGYLIVDRLGVTILRDPYTSKGRVKFYARRRVGGGVVDFDSIKLLKFR